MLRIDPSGRYTLAVSSGTWDVSAPRTGYSQAVIRTVTVPPGATGIDRQLRPLGDRHPDAAGRQCHGDTGALGYAERDGHPHAAGRNAAAGKSITPRQPEAGRATRPSGLFFARMAGGSDPARRRQRPNREPGGARPERGGQSGQPGASSGPGSDPVTDRGRWAARFMVRPVDPAPRTGAEGQQQEDPAGRIVPGETAGRPAQQVGRQETGRFGRQPRGRRSGASRPRISGERRGSRRDRRAVTEPIAESRRFTVNPVDSGRHAFPTM